MSKASTITIVLAASMVMTSAALGQSKTGTSKTLSHSIMDANDVTLWVSPQGWMDHASWGAAGQNHLWDAGLWVGRNQNVMAWDQWFSEDWAETDPRSEVTDASGKTLQLFFDDSAAPASERIGLDVEQTVYQWTAPERDDFLIVDYRISNTSGGDLTNLYVGIYLDPDITVESNSDNDFISYDASSKLLYANDTTPLLYPGHFGITILDSPSGQEPLTASSWTIGPDDPESDSDEFALMTSGTIIGTGGTAGDHRGVLTAQPLNLGAAETARVAFGLVMGFSLTDLQNKTSVMRDAYEAIAVATDPVSSDLPQEIHLYQNYPNPFNPTTTISYELPQAADATLTVVDPLGRVVRELASGTQPAGRYEMSFDAAGLPSGVYLYRLKTTDNVETKRMVVVK